MFASVVEASYDGPHLSLPITLEFVMEMVEHFRAEKRLHQKYAYMVRTMQPLRGGTSLAQLIFAPRAQLILQALDFFEKQPTLVDIRIPDDTNARLTVCGDIHGQFYDLLVSCGVAGSRRSNSVTLGMLWGEGRISSESTDIPARAIRTSSTATSWTAVHSPLR